MRKRQGVPQPGCYCMSLEHPWGHLAKEESGCHGSIWVQTKSKIAQCMYPTQAIQNTGTKAAHCWSARCLRAGVCVNERHSAHKNDGRTQT